MNTKNEQTKNNNHKTERQHTEFQWARTYVPFSIIYLCLWFCELADQSIVHKIELDVPIWNQISRESIVLLGSFSDLFHLFEQRRVRDFE